MNLMHTFLTALVCIGASATAVTSDTAQSARDAAREYGAAVRKCDMVWALDRMYPPIKYSMADRLVAADSAKESERAKRIMGLSGESEQQLDAHFSDGLRRLRAKFDEIGRQMRAGGLKVENFTVGEATSEYVVAPPTGVINTVKRDTNGRMSVESMQDGRGRSRIVILPTRLILSIPDAKGVPHRVQRDSYIYAIRDEIRPDGVKVGITKLNVWYFVDGNTSINQLRAFFPKLPLNLKTPVCSDRELN